MKNKVQFLGYITFCLFLVACGGAVVPTMAPPATPAATKPSGSGGIAPAPESTLPPSPTQAAATAVPTAPAEEVAVTGDAQTDILAAFNRMIARPYRTETVINSEGSQLTMNNQFSPPDKVHMLTAWDGLSMQTIIIGSQGWVKNEDEAWEDIPEEMVPVLFEIEVRPWLGLTNPQIIGQEELNGRGVWVYTYDLDQKGALSHNTLYVDVTNGLPVQQKIEGSAFGVASSSVQTIFYDDTVVITAP